jgi:oligopeptide/dipeptide ABC transporter ATP-binding protein
MYAGYVVEAAVTRDLFARPRHPYTVGLLHSIPRLDAQPGEPLIPIEGAPPDLRHAPVGCQFAPRCAWRQDRCWQEMPPLDPIDPNRDFVATGPQATHRAACWNQPTPEEAVAARPLRSGFEPAPPPAEAGS